MSYAGVDVLVTGADGFIGSHLTEALIAESANVTALSAYNSFDSHGWLDELAPQSRRALELVRGDIRDPVFTGRLLRGKQVVFHLAALIAIPHSYRAAHSYVDTNVVGTLNVLEAARDSAVRRVVHTSTSEVYGTAQTLPIAETHPLQGQSPYSASKISADMMAEAFARSFELPVAIMRPFNTYGPRQSERAIIPTIIRQALDPHCADIQVGDLTPSRDLTFVEDTVAAFLALGAAQGIEYGRPYNSGTGTAVTMGELLELILDCAGCNKPVTQDRDRFRPAGSEVRALLADYSRLQHATGWAPRTRLREGVRRTVEWWRSRFERRLVRADRSFMV